jgi:hypothetical protein
MKPTYTAKADVFSFAMTCYEVVSGELPYSSDLPWQRITTANQWTGQGRCEAWVAWRYKHKVIQPHPEVLANWSLHLKRFASIYKRWRPWKLKLKGGRNFKSGRKVGVLLANLVWLLNYIYLLELVERYPFKVTHWF